MPDKRRRGRRIGPLRIIFYVAGGILFVVAVAGLSAWYLWNHSSTLNPKTMFQPQQKVDFGMPTPSPSPVPEKRPDIPESYDLYEDGRYYRLRGDVVSVLFMGIDSRSNEAAKSNVAVGTNQADTILLGIFDTGSGEVRILHIPRDTEADVRVLDIASQYVKTEKKHICLQHAYGDGAALSCELTMDAASELLFGIPINRYVSMGTNGVISAVNAVGGVTLTMLDDFSYYSDAMGVGKTVKLNGKRALTYIQARSRRGLDGTDQSRMKRQIQFMKAFISTLKEGSRTNPALVLSVYDAVKDYLQTNLSLEELLFLANQGLSVELTDESILRLPGAVGAEEQPLFHMDEDAARALVLELFYEQILPG